jgi:hypothetical protein
MLAKIVAMKEGKDKYSEELTKFMRAVANAKKFDELSEDPKPVKEALSDARYSIGTLASKNPAMHASLYNYTVVQQLASTRRLNDTMRVVRRQVDPVNKELDAKNRKATADALQRRMDTLRGGRRRTRRTRKQKKRI